MRHTYDAATVLKDAGLVLVTGNATVNSVAQILDVGAGALIAQAVLDVSAIENQTDELFTILLQGSNSPTFASGIVTLATAQFGNVAVLPGPPSAAPGTGRYELGFVNRVGSTIYRYIRIRVVVGGTVTTGINFSAWLATQNLGKVG